MTTEQQGEQQGVDQGIGEALVRIRRIWGASIKTPEHIAEYRRVLGKAVDAPTLHAAVEAVIDQATDRNVPPPGVFARAISDANARRLIETKTTHPHRSRSLDESALLDALAFVEGCTNDVDRAYGERQVKSIRKRLEDRGAAAEARVPLRFKRGTSYPNDPPGTVRYVPVARDDDYVFPKGPRNGGAIAAVLPLALVVISGAWRVIG